MRSLFFVLFCLGGAGSALAQNLTVSGRVLDRETKTPLPFASVYVKGKSIGTITNINGEFDFHVPQDFRNDMLVISMLGYSNFESPVWAMESNATIVIEMNASSIVLSEVVVADSLRGSDILRLALSHIKTNYPEKPFLMDGFYRDVKKVGGTYISLLEAAVQIYDENYAEPRNKFKLREGVRLIEVRKSLGYESKFTTYFDQVNLLEDLLLHNDVRYRQFPEEDAFFDGLVRLPNTIYDGNEVFVVSRTTGYKLSIYIDKLTYGILHLSFESNLMNDDHKKQSLISRFVYVKREVNFKRIANKLFLSYLSMDSKINWYDIETNELKFETAVYQQLLINRVNPNPAERIRSVEKMRNYSLQFQDRPYNKAFWENYNVIKESPLDRKILEDLEKVGPLDDQFEGKY
jgi:hypothetical protein